MTPGETPFDPTPDPRLAAALRALGDEPPLESVDWEALRASVRDRAGAQLARRRAGGAAPARGRSLLRPLLPLAAAATVALVAIRAGRGGDDPAPAVPGPLSAEEVFRPDLSEQEFRRLVTGAQDPEALLLLALEGG